jgi:hypothetical protein
MIAVKAVPDYGPDDRKLNALERTSGEQAVAEAARKIEREGERRNRLYDAQAEEDPGMMERMRLREERQARRRRRKNLVQVKSQEEENDEDDLPDYFDQEPDVEMEAVGRMGDRARKLPAEIKRPIQTRANQSLNDLKGRKNMSAKGMDNPLNSPEGKFRDHVRNSLREIYPEHIHGLVDDYVADSSIHSPEAMGSLNIHQVHEDFGDYIDHLQSNWGEDLGLDDEELYDEDDYDL